jgi:hypothetical protein
MGKAEELSTALTGKKSKVGTARCGIRSAQRTDATTKVTTKCKEASEASEAGQKKIRVHQNLREGSPFSD